MVAKRTAAAASRARTAASRARTAASLAQSAMTGAGETTAAHARVNSPEYDATIRGAPAFAELDLVLRPGQTVMSNGGSLAYMREGVERGKLKVGSSVFGMVKRALGGQSIFLVSYKGLDVDDPESRRVTFSSPVPGDVLCLEMSHGARVIVSRESYMAGSPSIKVSGKLNWRGMFEVGQDEGLVLPELQCDGTPGTAWLGAYGGFKRHDLKVGNTLLVDNGLFLACVRPAGFSGKLYSVVKLGKTLISSLLGGEGLGMKFDGPATVYTQSHNLNDLAGMIAARLPDSSGSSNGFNLGGGAKKTAGGEHCAYNR